MIAISTFVTNYINQRRASGYVHKNEIQNAVKAYVKHLQTDVPKTVGWAMIEKQLVIALEHMEDPDKSKKERTEWICPRCSYTNSSDNDNCGGSEIGDG